MLLTRLQQPVINLMLVVITRLEMYFHQSSNIILNHYYRALVSGTDPGPPQYATQVSIESEPFKM